jgi:hypothetical protein
MDRRERMLTPDNKENWWKGEGEVATHQTHENASHETLNDGYYEIYQCKGELFVDY